MDTMDILSAGEIVVLNDYICCFYRVNVQTNKLSQIFCGDFGKKFPWFIECPLASSGTSDKPRELYSRSPLKIPDLVDISLNIDALDQSDCIIYMSLYFRSEKKFSDFAWAKCDNILCSIHQTSFNVYNKS